MRGGGEVRSITIETTPEYLGHTMTRIRFDAAFLIYAGPWDGTSPARNGPNQRSTTLMAASSVTT
jgi:hypothetical protein